MFFFGAGASAPFGIPTMRQMTTDFTNVLDKNGTQNEQRIYHDIVDNLRKTTGVEPDVEAVFSIIEFLRDFNIESLGEATLYAMSKAQGNLKLGYDSIIPNGFTLESGQSSTRAIQQVIPTLESRFQRFIRTSCRVSPDNWTHIENVYKDFFRVILSFAGSHTGGETPYVTEWKIFTTNYDTIIEEFWREIGRVPISTGFSNANPPIFQPDLFLNPNQGFQLVKLHGSRNWLINKRTGATEEKEYDIDQAEQVATSRYNEEVMIYPLSQKQLFLEPYIQMFYALNRDALRKQFWLIIGYSFRDPIILRIFTSLMDKYSNKVMILVDPEAESITKSRLSKYGNRIVRISEKFGEKNYQIVNDKIIRSALARIK